jgi:spore germination protein YaaH
MFEQGVQQKADDIIKHAQDEANKEIDDAIKTNQEKVELENKFNEAKSEISLLKAKIFLTEKTKYLRPTVARKICEQLDDKSFEEVEKEFEEVKAEAEADVDAQVKRVRQQKQNNGPKLDKSLNQEEEEDTATNQEEETSVDMNESIKGSFAKAISTRIKKKL